MSVLGNDVERRTLGQAAGGGGGGGGCGGVGGVGGVVSATATATALHRDTVVVVGKCLI